MITLSTPDTTPQSHLIHCHGGTFALLIRRPTYAQRVADEGWSFQVFGNDPGQGYAQQIHHRLTSCVVGWKAVYDANGAGLMFSHDALRTLLGEHPDALQQVLTVLGTLFSANAEKVGKSEPPPVASGAADDTTETPHS